MVNGECRVPNNLLIGLDELPSWHDGGLPHFLPLGVSSLRFEPRPSVLPSMGSMGESLRPLTCEGVAKGPLV